MWAIHQTTVATDKPKHKEIWTIVGLNVSHSCPPPTQDPHPIRTNRRVPNASANRPLQKYELFRSSRLVAITLAQQLRFLSFMEPCPNRRNFLDLPSPRAFLRTRQRTFRFLLVNYCIQTFKLFRSLPSSSSTDAVMKNDLKQARFYLPCLIKCNTTGIHERTEIFC